MTGGVRADDEDVCELVCPECGAPLVIAAVKRGPVWPAPDRRLVVYSPLWRGNGIRAA